MNFTDILGSVLNQGMTRSGGNRIDHSMGNSGLGGAGGIGDILSSLGGGGSSGGGTQGGSMGGLGGLGDMLGSVLGSGGSGKGNSSLITGGLGALAGAIFGGGGGAVKGALGGSALALLGSLALKALQGRGGSPDPSAQLMAGLRAPENTDEEREVQSVTELTVRAMFNAAKADGQVDRDELERIIGKLSEDGLSTEEREFVNSELKKPMDTAGLIRAVPNPQVAAQVYAASLLAIEVDTDAERVYLAELASGLGLDHDVTGQLHSALGVG